MDQTDYLLRLASRVRQAILKRDFEALERLNHEVHDVVSGMAAKQVLSVAERESLVLLKVAHRAAIALLASESARLVDAMNGLNARRAGWEAYAAQGGLR